MGIKAYAWAQNSRYVRYLTYNFYYNYTIIDHYPVVNDSVVIVKVIGQVPNVTRVTYMGY